MISVLYIGIGPYHGGPISSLVQLLENIDKNKIRPFVFSLPNPHRDVLRSLTQIKEVKILEKKLWINNWLNSSGPELKQSVWHKLKLPGRILRSFYNSWIISKLIRDNKIDIVHTNIELIIDGAIAAIISGKPHIWHIRAPLGKNGAVKHFLGLRFCCNLISLLSTKIIVNSLDTFSSISANINSNKIKLVYNGINPVKYNSDEPNNSIRKLLGIKCNYQIVASVGYLSKIKGGDVFLRIATKIISHSDDVIFVWIGPSFERKGDPFCDAVFSFLANNHLEDKILFTGERSDVNDLLLGIDVFLHPMVNGSWSRVVLEAMAAARPVIAIEEHKKSEIIENGNNGILVTNEQEAVDEIERLLDDKQLCKLLGMKAHAHVLSNFSNSNTAFNIMSIYESIMNN